MKTKEYILCTLAVFGASLFCAADVSNGAVEEWVRHYNGPGSGPDRALDVAVDYLGNIYITGSTVGGATERDYTTIKYGPRCESQMQWDKSYDGPAHDFDEAKAIAVDGAGNVYVTGCSKSDGSDSQHDYATVKYDPNGNHLWTRRYDGLANDWDEARAIIVDDACNVYVTGFSMSYDLYAGYHEDYTTIKYDPNGIQQWVVPYDGEAAFHVDRSDRACAIAKDKAGNIYVTGTSAGPETGSDYATIKYDSAGKELWVRRYDGPGHFTDEAESIAVDSVGNLCVTGASWEIGTQYDYATIKYDPNGQEVWVSRYDGPGHLADYARDIAIDRAGNVYVTGSSKGSGAVNDDDCTTIKYDPNGNELWVRRYESLGPARPGNAIALDVAGNVYVTGATCGNSPRTDADCVTISYDPNGKERWARKYNYDGRNSWDQANAIAVDNAGNVYITGSSELMDDANYLTIKYSQDKDEDGLSDIWESVGIYYNDDETVDLDLSALGADPCHKDIFVEVDAMVGRAPTRATLNRVVAAFAAAPNALVNNPDGNDGITLHYDLADDDANIPLADWPNAFVGFDALKAKRFGDPNQRLNPNWKNIRAAKTLAYHYCVFANTHSGGSSSGKSEQPGNDFMVTLGAWSTPGGDPNQQAGTFMHELGHNLNLRHGGADDDNYKPNYHSTMNYTWQFPLRAYAASWVLDYSRQVFPTLDESNLSEPNGIGGHAGHRVRVGPLPARTVNENGPVNWNRDGDSNDLAVVADINRVLGSTPASPNDVLQGYEDWSNLRYQLCGHGNFQDGVHLAETVHNEMDFETFLELSRIGCAPWDVNCDGLVDFRDFAITGDQWLQAPGYPSGDIAPAGGDDIVDFWDVTLLVEHWLEETIL